MGQFEEKELVKVASMYHEEGMTQAAIARRMGVSRSLISKILLDAKKNGIVEVFIRSISAYTVDLERKLEKKYNLHNAIVVDTFDINEYEIEKRVSQAAANYVSKISKDMTNIGISWGKSLRSLVDHYTYTNRSDMTVYPLIGGMGDDSVDIHSNQLSYDLARRIRGKAKYLYSPALVSNCRIKEELISNDVINNVIEEGKMVELALVGISTPYEKSTMLSIGYINQNDIDEFKKLDVVGDINSLFFDKSGQEVNHRINQHVIGLELADLAKIPYVMTIAYDDSKVDAINVALENELINIIAITDSIAEKILND